MNALIIGNTDLTMTSREIAELSGRDHKNVLADIRKMLEELGKSAAEFSAVYKDQQLIDRPCFNLPKRETLILVSGYNIAMRAKIIDRWQELEARPAPLSPVNLSRLQLIELAMQSEQERLALESKVAIIQPKSDALDRIATHSEGSHCIRDAAAILQVREKALYSLLSEAGWIYKRPTGSGWLAYGPVRAKMLMEHKVTVGQKEDGSEWKTEQPRITARGMAKIALMIESGQLQGMAA